MRGNGGSDILEGGSGNDLLEGGGFFSDTYIFRKGHGHDTVRDYAANDSQTDTLRFTGASAKKAVFVRRGNDLVVKVYDSDDQVTLQDYFASSNGDRYRFQFDDATLGKTDIAKRSFFFSGTEKSDVINGWQSNDTIYGRDGNDRIFGNAGNDTLHGDAGDDTLYGNEGDDRLLGGEGNDTLDGGNDNDQLEGGVGNDILHGQAGSDTLEGGAGDDTLEGGGFFSDTYVFYTGHGRDTVRDYAANDAQADTLRFVGTKAKNVVFSREGNDLVVKAYGRDDQVTLKDYFASSNGDRYHFRFDDTTLGKADIIKQTSPKAPTAGKPLTAQSIHEKQRLAYTLAEDAFHTANQDDKLAYSARLADGKPLPRWLSFNAATRTFSGTPGNDDVGMLNIEVSAKGKGGSASQRLTLNVINVNDAPQIGAAIANHTSESGKPLQYRLPANAFKDIDKGDVLTLSAKLENGQPLPSWLSFDGKTGQFSGTPPSSRTANNYRIAVTATDKGGLSARQNFTLSTKPAANQPPRVAINLPVQKMNEKSRWQYTIPANAFHDADGDSLSYSATQADGKPLPKWLNFNAANRTFSGTPGNDDVGNLALRITASDNRGGVASQNLALQIANVNDAPQIGAAIANHTSESGKPLQYRLPANAFKDIDKGDVLTLSAKLENGQPLPSWLSFDGKTGQFSGTPPSSRTANNYRIAVTATDKAGAQVSQKFSLMTAAGAVNIIRGTGKESSIQGTSGNDTIYVGDNPLQGWRYKEVYGYDGDDVIYSGSGRDAIYGGAGNDILYTNGTEHDSLYGGYGDDIYRLGADFRSVSIKNFDLKQYDWRPQRRDVIEFMAHKRDYFNIYRTGDNLYLQGRDGQEVSIFDQFSNQGNNQHYINEFRFTDKTLTAADIKALLNNGTPGNDTLYAKPEGSRLYSGDGNDRIFGNQGNDYLYGEAGNDTIYGRAGDDYLWGEIGNDLLYGGTGKDMLNGGSGDDQLYGDAGDDRLFGDKGNDVLHGGEGNDKLDGSLDDDWLFGEAGDDELFGSTGNDVLNGGAGNDRLDGYTGNDIYQFQGNFGEDIIQNESNSAMLAGSQYDRIDFLDLKPDDLYFRKIGDNLVIISKKHAQNRVTVLSHFRDNGNTAARIDEIRFVDGTKLDYAAINRLVQKNSSGNAASADSVRRGNLFASDAAHQAQQINQAIAALNGQAQPLHALAIPDEKQPLLTTVNPY